MTAPEILNPVLQARHTSESPRFVACGGMTVDNVVTGDGRRLINVCGGNAFYSAVGMAVWSDRVGIVARVGDDYPGECLERAAEHRIDLRGLRLRPGPHALRVAFAYRADGARTRGVPSDILQTIPADERILFRDTTFDDETYLAFNPRPADFPDGWIASAEGVHLPALRFVTHDAITADLRGRRTDLTISIDSPWYEGSDVPGENIADVLARATVVLPSAEDLRVVWPELEPEQAARALIARGARAVVVKLGSRGSLVIDADGVGWHVPAVALDSTEPTGAGDAFCGGLLVGLVENQGDLVEAACRGTVSASLVVETDSPMDALDRLDRVTMRDRLGVVRGGISRIGGAS